MSFSITIFGPSHHWWKKWRKPIRRVWFERPNEFSTGGVGFCVPGLHVVLYWGMEKEK